MFALGLKFLNITKKLLCRGKVTYHAKHIYLANNILCALRRQKHWYLKI